MTRPKIITLLAALTLGACSATQIASVNATLASVAQNDLPTACGIVVVAEGYFNSVNGQSKLSASQQATEAKAAAAATAICANPPTSLASALASLNTIWVAIESATTVPGT